MPFPSQVFNFKVTRTKLYTGEGRPDKLLLFCDELSSPEPHKHEQEPGCAPACFQIEIQEGYGQEWCEKVGIKVAKLLKYPD